MIDVRQVDVPAWLQSFRRFAMDDALLLFDRDSGMCALLDGAETVGLRQVAPRVVQFALTNVCNLTCDFCYRDLESLSKWDSESVEILLKELASAGVMEVAFGGGEPLLFPGFLELIEKLHDETPLAISATSNGTRLQSLDLHRLGRCVAQLRISVYPKNHWLESVRRLADAGVRSGINYLLTPDRLDHVEHDILRAAAAGCTDVLFLSYNGADRSMHLQGGQVEAARRSIARLSQALGHAVKLKLSICWGHRMSSIPQLFHESGCAAGKDFVVVTSDRTVMPCSFHHIGIPFGSAGELLDIWRQQAARFASAANIDGCARRQGCGLEQD